MKLILTLSLMLMMNHSAFSQAKAKKAPMAPATYAIDTANSKVVWIGKRTIMPTKHNGTVKLSSGSVVMNGDALVGGEFEIDMTTIANQDLTDAEKQTKLIGHLKSDDFFNVEKFPKAKFVLKSAKAAGNTVNIVGDLTIRDKTNEISFPAMIKKDNKNVIAKADFKIDRTLFDVKYGSDKFFKSVGDKVIGNEIEFSLDLTAKTP